jgi:predicted nucleotidyltransferase
MPFSVLLERREKDREIHRQEVIGGVRRASLALRTQFKFDEVRAFGSLVSGRFDRHSDIDLAIKGLPSEYYFKAYAFLLHALAFRHELDLKPYEDLDENMRRRVDEEGLHVG